jgi:hypothetical protein
MRIESILQRVGGTTVELGDETYRFVPSHPGGPHVAEVSNPAHIQRLLSITEGFRPADGEAPVGGEAFAVGIDGPFFVMRGPADIVAFRQWADTVPALVDIDTEADPDLAMGEQTSLADKIARGEAVVGDYVDQLDDRPPNVDLAPARGVESPAPPFPVQAAPDYLGTIQPVGEVASSKIDSHAAADILHGNEQAVAEIDAEDAPVQLDREPLAVKYKGIFGHRPNGKWDAKKIAEVLAEHETGNGAEG